MDDPFRVMVVDDSVVIRGLLTQFLEADPEISVIASVSNGQIALSKLDRHDVEIIVLDIEMPVMDGMTALPLLLAKKPDVQVFMMYSRGHQGRRQRIHHEALRQRNHRVEVHPGRASLSPDPQVTIIAGKANGQVR